MDAAPGGVDPGRPDGSGRLGERRSGDREPWAAANGANSAHRLKILTVHLLKWQFQPQKRSKSWGVTIKMISVNEIEQLLRRGPEPAPRDRSADRQSATESPRANAAGETGLGLSDVPLPLSVHGRPDSRRHVLPWRRPKTNDPLLQLPHRRPDPGRSARDPRRRPGLRRPRRELSRPPRRALRQRDPLRDLPPGERCHHDGGGLRQAHRPARHRHGHPRPGRHQRRAWRAHRAPGFRPR